ncbi:MAG: DUF881 domain-containing protein [Clostridia bacterium]
MKGKIIMLITIGIICALLTSVMFVQFKSVQVIEESGVGAMLEAELRSEYSEIKEKNAEIEEQIEETQKSIDEYNKLSTDDQGARELLREDVTDAEMDLGYTDVKGPGLIITLSDGNNAVNNDDEVVKYYDLLLAINELKYAGAEAISINDERYVTSSYIASIQNMYMVMNGQRITSPYTIKVIGDAKYLESVINIKGGLSDQMKSYNKNISYTVENEIRINKYENLIEINYGE